MNLHSWGRYPRIDSNVFELKDVVELNDYISIMIML